MKTNDKAIEILYKWLKTIWKQIESYFTRNNFKAVQKLCPWYSIDETRGHEKLNR